MTPPAENLSEFIPAESLQEHLKISRTVLRSWMASGLPFIRVGLRLYFRERSVARWLSTQERTQDPLENRPAAVKVDNQNAREHHQGAPQRAKTPRKSTVHSGPATLDIGFG